MTLTTLQLFKIDQKWNWSSVNETIRNALSTLIISNKQNLRNSASEGH